MKDERVDDLLGDLRVALAVDPSPAFAARVRDRVAAAPARAWRRGWVLLPLAATAAGLVVALIVWPPGVSTPVQEATPPVVITSVSTPATSTSTIEPVEAADPHAAAPLVTRAERPLAAVSGRASAPAVIVPPAEREALTRWLVALRSGRAPAGPATESVVDEETGALRALRPIEELAPIVVPPLVPAEGGGDGRRGR